MESGAQPVRRSESLRKRTLDDRKSTVGGEFSIPPKQRKSDEAFANRASYADRDIPVTRSTSERFSIAVDLKQFHQAHDVDEHFRRSLESIKVKRQHHQQNTVPSNVPVLKSVDHTNQVVASADHESHHIMVAENSTLTTPLVTSKPSPVATLSSSITSSSTHSYSSPSSTTTLASTTAMPALQNLQYYINSATGTVFAAGVPSNQVPAGMAGLQVPPLIFGLPSGFQQPVSVAQSMAQSSLATVKMSTPKPVAATANTQQQLLAVAAAAGMAQQGGILMPQLTSSANPGFISIIDSNGIPQLLATSTPGTTVATAAAATQAVNGAHSNSSGGGGSNSPVFLLGPSNVPVVPPGFFFISPSDLSSVQTASAVNAAAAGLVNFNNQAVRTSTSSPGYIVLPSSAAVQAPMNISGLTQDQLLTLLSVQQQQQQQQQQQLQQLQQQQMKGSLSPSPSPLSSLAGGRSVTTQEPPTAAVQNIMAGGGGSVEDHFARALGEQWVKVKQGSGPQQNKITA